MNTNILLIIIVIVMVAGLIATLKVGFSKDNASENAQYGKNTGKRLTRLTMLYIVTIAVAITAFIMLLNR